MEDRSYNDASLDDGLDIIGDVHGESGKLHRLLTALGYLDHGDGYRTPRRHRRAVFVGDLIDRGRGQRETLAIVKAMTDNGDAVVVMGNHEYNAIAYSTPDPSATGEYLRRHRPKNDRQHAAFISAFSFGSDDHNDVINWFRSMPLWLELDGLRVVHACWDQSAMDALGGNPYVNDALMTASSVQDSTEQMWVEHLCKGPEIPLPDGITFTDKDGHRRAQARHRWWDPTATTYPTACEVPPNCPDLPDRAVEDLPVPPYDAVIPVVFGHYWRQWGDPDVSARAACVDHSAVLGGPLTAYRWSGEQTLTPERLMAAP